MNTINTDFVRQKWQYKPEFGTADMTSLSSISNNITANVSDSYLADEIKRELNRIYREREAEMSGINTTPITPAKPIPKKVIFSGPATTILWRDGTKTTVKCARHDIYDEEVGIAMCYLKKMLGNKGNFNNIFREAMKVRG